MRDSGELVDIAREATAIGRDLIAGERPREVQAKGDRDTFTDLDVRVEREIRSFLRERTPEIGFLGEEEGRTDAGEDGDVWTLDPIDGTSNFVHGVPLSAVSLGLVQGDRATVAAIRMPSMDLTYTAARGEGAYCGDRRLQVSDATRLEHSLVSIGDYAVGAGADEENARRIRLTSLLAANIERVRMFGTAAIDLAWIAEGRTDATVILTNKPWDTAAGVLLAREAGARVTDSAGRDHTTHSDSTVATAPGISEAMLSLIRESR